MQRIIQIADKIVEYSLYCLFFFIPISITAISIFIVLSTVAFLIKKIIQVMAFKQKSYFKNFLSPIHATLILFYIFCGLSIVNSSYLKISFTALFFKWGKNILLFFTIEDTFIQKNRLRKAIIALLAAGSIVVVDVFSQKFIGWEFIRHGTTNITNNISFVPAGPFKHYNSLSAYLVCILTIMLALISYARHKKSVQLLGLFMTILMGFSLAFTFSRGGWLGFFTAVLLMLFLSRKWKFAFAPFILLAIIILIPNLRERMLFVFKAHGDASRFDIWQGALGMIKESPFLGKGLGTFMANFPKYSPNLGTQYSHNSFLQIWAESGIFAFLNFFFFVFLLLQQGIRAFRKSRDYFVLGLLCATFGFLVHSIFDNHLYSLQLSALFWSMAGMLAASTKKTKSDIAY